MALTWPKERRVIGTKVTRLDGPDKATGKAKYSYDINRPGMLHAGILRTPYAHAKVKTLDTSAAEKMPGVKAVHVVAGPGKELFYAGDEIGGLAADTEEHVKDGLRAIKIEYEVLDFIVKEAEALKEPNRKTVPGGKENNLIPSQERTAGNVDDAFKQADFVHEGLYGVPTISHQCLESHGLVAEWEGDGKLTVWCSTQAVTGTVTDLAGHFRGTLKKPVDVKCITHYMGGGFGSKFGADIQGKVAAELALKAKAPVKLMLDRADEITTAGNRPSAFGKVKIAGTKDGKITAYEIESYGGPGVGTARTVG